MKRRKKPDMKRKAKRLAEQKITQVWLLATPAEADDLMHWHVPLEIQRQAQYAISVIQEEVSNGKP